MKLLNITTKYFLISFLIILLLWAVVFYFIMKGIIYHDVDESLWNRKVEILRAVEAHPELLQHGRFAEPDFSIEPITAGQAQGISEHFEKIMLPDPLEHEPEPYRQLVTTFASGAGHFKLTIRTSLVDSLELMQVILLNALVLFAALFVFVVLLNRKLLQRLWLPFYETLRQIRSYRLEQPQEIRFPETEIAEFSTLNETIARLIQNNLQAFEDQKRFTENASHEIQTPLAIARNKTELLMQNPNLSEEQAHLVQELSENLSRLSRLNRSLLLLSKIQNNQFPETEEIDVAALIRRLFDDLKELLAFKHISFEMKTAVNPVLKMNPDLAQMLFGNLVRNAIRHNTENGSITVVIKENEVSIENTGQPFDGDTRQLFQRFNKNSCHRDSSGLGLSIVKSICDFYRFSISYTVEENIHKISLRF